MRYTDLIFDLYGTLVDIHTEETAEVWEKTALYFRFYGVPFRGPELQSAFRAELKNREAREGQSYECFPDIPFEQILSSLLRDRGMREDTEELGKNAAQLFRILSIEYLRLYPGVTEALTRLRQQGFRLWLLSNAQRVFTAYEIRSLGLEPYFDGIWLSSDYRCRKPDLRFFRAPLLEKKLRAENCLMVGNDLLTDIAGAKAAGMATFYMHSNLTPPDQRKADPQKHPDTYGGPHWEYEGYDWVKISRLLGKICS